MTADRHRAESSSDLLAGRAAYEAAERRRKLEHHRFVERLVHRHAERSGLPVSIARRHIEQVAVSVQGVDKRTAHQQMAAASSIGRTLRARAGEAPPARAWRRGL